MAASITEDLVVPSKIVSLLPNACSKFMLYLHGSEPHKAKSRELRRLPETEIWEIGDISSEAPCKSCSCRLKCV